MLHISCMSIAYIYSIHIWLRTFAILWVLRRPRLGKHRASSLSFARVFGFWPYLGLDVSLCVCVLRDPLNNSHQMLTAKIKI